LGFMFARSMFIFFLVKKCRSAGIWWS
jgi:hypothetical protein